MRLLHEWTLLTLLAVFVGGVGALLWQMSVTASAFAEAAALQDAARTSEALASFRSLYSSEVVDRMRSHGIEVTHDYEMRDGSIPLPATLTLKLGDMIGRQHTGSLIRLYSDYPFPWREDGGPHDAFEADALVELRRNPDRPFVRIEDHEGRQSLRFATADRMQASCVACHNSHLDSPKTDWKVGDVRGVLEVVRPLDGFVTQAEAQMRGGFMLFMTLAVFGLAAMAFFVVSVRRTLEAARKTGSVPMAQAYDEGDRKLSASTSRGRFLLLGAVVAGAIFLVDLSIPLGVAVGVPYILLVLLSLRSDRESHVVFAATVGTALTILGFALSPDGGELWKVLANRLLAIFAVWVTAILCLWQKRRTSEQARLIAEKTATQNENSIVKEALRKLEESEARIRAIVNTAADGIITIDEKGTIQSFNGAAEAIFGYSESEAIGENVSMLIPSSFREEYDTHIQRYLETGERTILGERREVTGRREDGSTFPIDLCASEARLGDRRMFTGIVRDITKRKWAEQQLEELHQKVVEVSRQAGMAEIATGVLHNVGNVLNSVNVSATVVSDKLRKSKVSNLSKAAGLMHEHGDDLGAFLTEDERGQKLPAYLTKLAEHLVEERSSMIGELESLTKNIEHIKKIVSTQQSHAGTFGVVESVSIADVVEDALTVNATSFERYGIEMVRDYVDLPPIALDKQKLLQILVNLVRNAKHAVIDGDCKEKKLTLRISRHGDAWVRIDVADTGMGILKENLTRIFSHGFTTKKDGHGFGLHSAVLAAKEMGGSLGVHSDGPDTGATFTLELPLEPAKVEVTV